MPFKDDIRHLAGLKQQIWQKMILLVQHIALMSLWLCVCAVSVLLQGFHQWKFLACTHSSSSPRIHPPSCSSHQPPCSSSHPPTARRGCSSHRGYSLCCIQCSCGRHGVCSRIGRDSWTTSKHWVTAGWGAQQSLWAVETGATSLWLLCIASAIVTRSLDKSSNVSGCAIHVTK